MWKEFADGTWSEYHPDRGSRREIEVEAGVLLFDEPERQVQVAGVALGQELHAVERENRRVVPLAGLEHPVRQHVPALGDLQGLGRPCRCGAPSGGRRRWGRAADQDGQGEEERVDQGVSLPEAHELEIGTSTSSSSSTPVRISSTETTITGRFLPGSPLRAAPRETSQTSLRCGSGDAIVEGRLPGVLLGAHRQVAGIGTGGLAL